MTTLTDRYVWAATRSLPEAQRDELGRELQERIGDAIDARIESGSAHAEAERAALVELGDPAQLVAAYVDRPLHLIGPQFFLTWWRLLKLLLAVVLPFAAAGVLLGQLIAGAGVGQMIGATIGTTLTVAVHLCFWTTLAFAIAERAPQAAPVEHWAPEQLPQPRDDDRVSRRADLIASLLFLSLLAAAIVWQQFGVVWRDGERQPIPALDSALWSGWIPFFLGLLVLEAAFAVVLYLRGWSWVMAGVNLLQGVAFTVPALWLFLSGQLIAPALLAEIGAPWDGDASAAISAVVVVAGVGIALWDVVDGCLKASRSRPAAGAGARRRPVSRV
jgi:hypothetical protein